MPVRHNHAALLVAGGSGSRAGGVLPKQYARVAGEPMIVRSYRALADHPAIGRVLVVIGDGHEALLKEALGEVPYVIGGATRRESVRNGLHALEQDRPDRILVHDAARPFLSPRVIDRLLEALETHVGAVPALPVADTLVRFDGMMGANVPRDGLHRVQTPQAFAFESLSAAHRQWPEGRDATDDAQMVREAGGDVTLVMGDPMLEKLTYPEDLVRLEAMARAALVSRTGLGFDVHAFAQGETLWLGGILVPFDRGLSGHSDADVALHALTDALLGAIGTGDIGVHFPPSDPQWRGAASSLFLEHARRLIEERHGRIDHVDLTIICEAPKLGPYREPIRARIAELLKVPVSSVSVKATTTERLGFTGRGEGIAAQAVATVRLPELP